MDKTVNFNKYKDNLIFIPLGGTNEIGVNVNLYGTDGKWIMVDCGAGFAEDTLPGADLVVADLSFIEKRRKDLLALIFTHSHEDHIGALPYLFDVLRCPIYASKFVKNFLSTKLAEYKFSKNVVINELQPNKKVNLGPFTIDTLYLTHSAPEMNALVINTKHGAVVHTGDWKFDETPVVGGVSEVEKLESYGRQGVLALVCDSTNVFSPGVSESESTVKNEVINLVSAAKGLVVVTTFASNVSRLDSIMMAAKTSKRSVILSGLSLKKVFEAAKKSGYFTDYEDSMIIDQRDFKKYPRNKLLVIATGCQGEPFAAMTRFVNDSDRDIKLAANDTVIFSSKIIPGNDKVIFRLFNKLLKKKINLITEMKYKVHASGHPNVSELERMYDIVRPRILIPVHGTPMHIHEHAALGKKYGIKHSLISENGDVVLIDYNNPQIIGKVQSGYFAIDGKSLLPVSSNIFKVRRSMEESGVIFVSMVLDAKNELVTSPVLLAPGLLDADDDSEVIELMINEIKDKMREFKILRASNIESSVRSVIRKIERVELGKEPKIFISIQRVNI